MLMYPPRSRLEALRWKLHLRPWWTRPSTIRFKIWEKTHPQPEWMYQALTDFLLPKEKKQNKAVTYGASIPHCDSLTLHRPGVCEYCDEYKTAQQLRIEKEIPFSGEPGAPDALFRPAETVTRWYGNRAAKKEEKIA